MKVYDTFAEEFIDEEEMEVIAPPERYIMMPDEAKGWISVKDGLPNEDCECWITLEYIKTGNRVLYESHYDTELEKFYNQKCLERKGYKLIAWQKKRMPSPYKGE